MTAGHTHRYVKVREGSLVYRVLKKTLLTTTNRDRVERSRMVFGVVQDDRDEHEHYTLTLLGLLHGLTGLTIRTQPRRYDQGLL